MNKDWLVLVTTAGSNQIKSNQIKSNQIKSIMVNGWWHGMAWRTMVEFCSMMM